MDVNINDSMHLVVVNKKTHKQQSLLFCNIKPYSFTLLRESELSLPLINASCFKDLCQFVKVSETRGYFICLAWVIDPHLSFSIRKGHLNSTKKNFRFYFWELLDLDRLLFSHRVNYPPHYLADTSRQRPSGQRVRLTIQWSWVLVSL